MKDFYSVNELAEQLGVTTRSIRNYLHEGKLKGTKVGGQWKFSERNLLNFFTEIKQMKQQRHAAIHARCTNHDAFQPSVS